MEKQPQTGKPEGKEEISCLKKAIEKSPCKGQQHTGTAEREIDNQLLENPKLHF